MVNQKLYKRFIALAISGALLISTSVVSVAQTTSQSVELAGMKTSGNVVEKNNRTVTGDNATDKFVIENGVLKEYTGEETEIIIPKGVTAIGEKAFAYNKLMEVTIPGNVKLIGKNAFHYCNRLTKVTILNGTQTIDDRAFYHCVRLADITIPGSVACIGGEAFAGCISLEGIEIPEKVAKIGNGIFVNCDNLETLKVDKDNPYYYSADNILYDYKKKLVCCPGGRAGDLTIPTGVTSIGEQAFTGNRWLENVTISGCVKSIGKLAFADCDLETVTISQGVKCIEDEAFNNCTLKSIRIPKSVTNIGERAFAESRWLESINIPEGVLSIREGTFAGSELKKVSIPSSVLSIDEDAFRYCGIREITIPENVKELEEGVFYGCENLKSVRISGNLKSIGKWAFSRCTSLKSITIPEGLKKIERYAFCDCTSLTSITIPKSVKKIGRAAFDDCSNLFTIYGKKGSYAEKYAKKHKIKFAIAKKTQSFKATREYSKTYKDSSFKLNARLKSGKGKLTYASSDAGVAAVNGRGRVTVKEPGIAVITVKAQKTSKYNAASVKITVKVSPAQPKMRTVQAQGGQKVRVSWSRDKYAAGYEIQCSTDEEFKDRNAVNTMTVKRGRATSATIKQGLEKGEKYYVRMRSYKDAKAGKKTQRLYSAWSRARSVQW